MDKDLLQKRYLSNNERYADLINGFLFAGKQIVPAVNCINRRWQK